MSKWRSASVFGQGRRVALDREQRAVFRAKLRLARGPGRLSSTAVALGEILLRTLGADGRLDPSIATLAARLGNAAPSTVTRCLERLRQLGFLSWTRRLVRDARTGWRAAQTSNAYVLALPSPARPCDAQIAPAVRVSMPKRQPREPKQESAYESAARQLRALGMSVPVQWAV